MINELNAYFDAIKVDYLKWSALPNTADDIAKRIRDEHYVKFAQGLRLVYGSQYIKVVSGSGVHSFIVREDGPKFRKGDILKAATWKAPAKNQARGNLFTGYTVKWTGAEYLR